MAPLNKGTSIYHTTQGLYWRDSNGTLLAVEGSNSKALPEAWPQLKEEICSNQGSWTQIRLPSGKQINTLQITVAIPVLNNIRANFPPSYRTEELHTQVAEIEHPNGLFLGMLSSRPRSLAQDAFTTWAGHFILLETQFQPFAELSETSSAEHKATCEKIAEIFEQKIKNVSKGDQWDVCGRDAFLNRVYGYVEKNLPILLALPAFPCKSPNPNKVGGTMPDLAEHLAMDVLRGFVKEVCEVYQPGATMWVISDGHVFSDCIGVDDALIDKYDARMVELYKEKFPVEDGPVPAMAFKGLQDIFGSKEDSFHSFQDSWVASKNMPHPVTTQLTDRAELCRKLMLGVAEADRAFIRSCIDKQEPDALQLYRGQTRFMLEDIADVPSVKKLSKKQHKKIAALVAQEMMSRNQAYSNLVELLLPNYVRLSIHAHNNAGPKFAVRLLPKNLVRPIESLKTRHEPVPAYEFQLPTPWHNCIIKVEGDDLMYLARSQIAKKAIAGHDFDGAWVEDSNGSYFSLKRLPPRPVLVRIVTSFNKKNAQNVVLSPVRGIRRIATFDEKAMDKMVHSPIQRIKRMTTFDQKRMDAVGVSPIHPKPINRMPVTKMAPVDEKPTDAAGVSPMQSKPLEKMATVDEKKPEPVVAIPAQPKQLEKLATVDEKRMAEIGVSPIQVKPFRRRDSFFFKSAETGKWKVRMPSISGPQSKYMANSPVVASPTVAQAA